VENMKRVAYDYTFNELINSILRTLKLPEAVTNYASLIFKKTPATEECHRKLTVRQHGLRRNSRSCCTPMLAFIDRFIQLRDGAEF
jgi:hypothetical protein